MNGKWIKIFTKFLNWEWYKDQNTKALFIHCLLKANWKDGKFEGHDIPRGSFVTGRKKLAQELGLSEQEIRTALKHLISTKELTIKKTNKFSIISIVKFEIYQQVNQQINQQLTTIEEYIEYKTNNSVCNNMRTCDENFECHLGSLYKTINCKNCMKKWKCPLPEEPTFESLYGKSFYKYVTEIELRKLEVAKELNMRKENNVLNLEVLDLFDDEEGLTNEE